MAFYSLDDRLIFPDPNDADEDGLIAIGGDLTIDRLLVAYNAGIFPWFAEYKVPFWYSPDPRCVIYPGDLKVSHSMQQLFKKNFFTVTLDHDFPFVIKQCAKAARKNETGTWISKDFQKAYIDLHNAGYAHSIEVWKEDKIVGGLYGVSLGSCFFGESMFTQISNASKYGFVFLVQLLKQKKFTLIDCQVYNAHLGSLGAINIERKIFLKELKKGLKKETLKGNWKNFL
ncbi:MAG: leucyl/phenylalanyl-tRNA--protein transferase [Fimbriimonadaceae bacterium]|nr:leucyl/phenylalanyl-tRNA--protein transferase [Chitinophagales bacterium]